MNLLTGKKVFLVLKLFLLPLSLSMGVCIKRVEFREKSEFFSIGPKELEFYKLYCPLV